MGGEGKLSRDRANTSLHTPAEFSETLQLPVTTTFFPPKKNRLRKASWLYSFTEFAWTMRLFGFYQFWSRDMTCPRFCMYVVVFVFVKWV